MRKRLVVCAERIIARHDGNENMRNARELRIYINDDDNEPEVAMKSAPIIRQGSDKKLVGMKCRR